MGGGWSLTWVRHSLWGVTPEDETGRSALSDFPAVALTFGATTTAPATPAPRRSSLPAFAAARGADGAGCAALQAQDDDLIETYAVSTFGVDDLTYPEDSRRHLSYVNPDAPRGGEIR